jgi:hypothetical protein
MNFAEKRIRVTIINIIFRDIMKVCGTTAERSLFTVLFRVRHVADFAGKSKT